MDSSTLRILDANLNRVREALRVIEDYTRFALDDADAAAQAKRLRHEADGVAARLGRSTLLSGRDIQNDVGREIKTPDELRRGTSQDVVAAALGRLTEAARALGEYAKLVSPQAAAAAEQIRYAAYELEQRVVLRGERRRRFRAVRLYVILTAALCRRDWVETAAAALRGGAGCLQLREKELRDAELLRRARQLRALTREHGALLILNDRPDIARLSGADGVHVGPEDLSVGEARRIGGAHLLVGKSTHTLEQVEAALAEEPDYVAVGPMFPSTTKPQAHAPGPGLLAEAVRHTELPVVGIGGITAANAGQVFAAGASCVCVCSTVISTEDAAAAARAVRAVVSPAAPSAAQPGGSRR